jgi:ABC-2 type transport system permease protein
VKGRLVDVYLQQLRTTVASQLQYRGALAVWLIGQVIEPLVSLVVWTVVSRSSGGRVGGYSPEGFAAYFITLMLVNHATFTWIMYEFEYRVRQGSLSFALLRPLHPIHSDVADNVAYKLITLPVLLVVALLLGLLFRPSAEVRPWTALVFVPSLLLACVLRFVLEWTVALSVFWTTRVSAVNRIYFVVLLFLSGQIAPLDLFPRSVRIAAAVLPFRWTVAFPVELVLGRLAPAQALTGLAVQLAWLVAALLLLRILWRSGLRAFSAVGA